MLLRCENLSAVYLSANPALHNRSKHFDTDWHYIREQVALGLIETRHVPSAQQVADIFTKSLPRREFMALRDKLGVGVPPTSSLRGNVRENGEVAHTASSVQAQRATLPKPTRQKDDQTKCQSQRQKSTAMTVQLSNRFDSLISVGEGD